MIWLVGLLMFFGLVMTLLYVQVKLKYEESRDRVYHQSEWFIKLADHIWINGKFQDSSGKSDGDYNSKEVEEQWKRFHDINTNFYKIKICERYYDSKEYCSRDSQDAWKQLYSKGDLK